MIFAGLIIIFIAAVVFFHFMQGFFSATMSAIFAIIAAVFAFSYHETIVENYLGGRMADSAHAMVLLVLFAAIYLALRIIFDNLVPGNVTLPSGFDKGGALVMGLVAAVFATGIIAIAAQELPFGTDLAGYHRYAVEDLHPVIVPTRKNLNSKMWDELSTNQPGQFGDTGETGKGVPLIPVDDIVVQTIERLSDSGGALEDGKPLQQVHPAFLDELFGQRMGIETGANRVAMNLDQHLHAMDIKGLYHLEDKKGKEFETDAEYTKIRNKKLAEVHPTANQMFLVVRILFFKQAADKDNLFRFSPGSCRLVVPKASRGAEEPLWTDYYPVGTYDNQMKKLFIDKLDDMLFIDMREGDHGADLVYLVDKAEFDKQAPRGTFIEVKRLARVDLGGMDVKTKLPPSTQIGILHPEGLGPNEEENPNEVVPPEQQPQGQSPRGGGRAQAAPQPQPEQPQPGQSTAFEVNAAVLSAKLPVSIKAPAGAPTDDLVQVPGGNAAFEAGKIKSANLDSSAQEQAGGTVNQLSIPEGQVAVEVAGTPAGAAPWAPAAETEQYEIVDNAGKHYPPNGIFVTYDSGGAEKFLLRYVADTTISGAAPPDANGKPKRVLLYFLVPKGTTVTEFDDHGQKAKDISVVSG